MPKAEANEMKKKLEDQGGAVELKSGRPIPTPLPGCQPGAVRDVKPSPTSVRRDATHWTAAITFRSHKPPRVLPAMGRAARAGAICAAREC